MKKRALISSAFIFASAFAVNFFMLRYKGCELGASVAVSAFAAVTLLSAKDDFLTGEVSFFLLVSPLLFFPLIAGSLDYLGGAVTFLALSVFLLFKKIGGADVLLYTEAALLFGADSLYIIYFSLMSGACFHYIMRKLSREKNKDCRSVRIIPAIYAALQIYLVIR